MSNLCNLLLEQEMRIWLDNNPEVTPETKTSVARTKSTTAAKSTPAATRRGRANKK
jgi:hypothetical protein